MPKLMDEPVVKMCVHLYRSDVEAIRKNMATREAPVNTIIRRIIRTFVTNASAEFRTAIDQAERIDHE